MRLESVRLRIEGIILGVSVVGMVRKAKRNGNEREGSFRSEARALGPVISKTFWNLSLSGRTARRRRRQLINQPVILPLWKYRRFGRGGEPDVRRKGLPLYGWRLPLLETCFNRRRLPLLRNWCFHRTADWDGYYGSKRSMNWLARRWRRERC
jgi:hypothetical protein